jgi:YidC/Oxa1 family membrane protein insertase
VAKISKHFHVDPASYEITVTHSVQNLSDDVIHVRIDQTGAPELPRDDPQGDDRYYHGMSLDSTKQTLDSDHGFNMTHLEERKLAAGTKNAAGVVENVGTVPIGTGSAKDGQFFDYTKNPQLWLASSNRFFTAIVRPLPETDNTKQFSVAGKFPIPEPGHLASANIDLMSMAVKPANDESIMRLTGRSLDVAKGATVDEPLAVYLGPKKRDILKGDLAATGKPSYFYAVYDYLKLVQFNTCALYSYCVVDQLALAILWVLDFLTHTVAFGNYGIAIMILVIVVRALMHPLTRASQMNMAKMGKQMRDVQPQLDAMKKRYADNKKRQSEEMMRIYRENKINPAGGIMGCLPMLIQMPIWAALYAGLRSDIDLRHAAFIPGWINDMASPDTILPSAAVVLGHPLFTIPLVGWDVYGLNLLPILLAGVFYFQMKVTSATQPKAADEQQAQMQKMSQYMIFMFPLFLYNAPSGLNLYIFASTMGGLLDTYIVRKALKKQGILTQSAALLPTKNDAAAND